MNRMNVSMNVSKNAVAYTNHLAAVVALARHAALYQDMWQLAASTKQLQTEL
jgi:hypothetical protein